MLLRARSLSRVSTCSNTAQGGCCYVHIAYHGCQRVATQPRVDAVNMQGAYHGYHGPPIKFYAVCNSMLM